MPDHHSGVDSLPKISPGATIMPRVGFLNSVIFSATFCLIFDPLPTLWFVTALTTAFVLRHPTSRSHPVSQIPCFPLTVGSACVIHDVETTTCRNFGASSDPFGRQATPARPTRFATRDTSSTLTRLLPSPDAATCPRSAGVAADVAANVAADVAFSGILPKIFW
ncbi:hypothetical protein PIB30_077894 [Stylosanthes scabra]|uniref:Uncharacterized protein n=1 Tax=Stylosanthes scabra TaxID=79078 RepID=A0ABU6VTB9_9FABA|nr:hypothetical protein [Stylosanthes scabra]